MNTSFQSGWRGVQQKMASRPQRDAAACTGRREDMLRQKGLCRRISRVPPQGQGDARGNLSASGSVPPRAGTSAFRDLHSGQPDGYGVGEAKTSHDWR